MVRGGLISGIGALVLLTASTAAIAKDAYVYGPPPDWAQYKTLGEAAVRALLPAAGRWQIDWPNGYKPAYWPMKGKPYGYVTCGFVRLLGGDGTILDSHPFAVVIDRGAVTGVDYKPKPSNSLPNLLCAGLNTSGAFPPPSSMISSTVSTSDATPVGSLGITVRPMPEGAYIVSVSAGSPAATAGLKPGTVIAGVNAVPIAKMGDAMAKVIEAAGPTAALTLVDGAVIKLGSK